MLQRWMLRAVRGEWRKRDVLWRLYDILLRAISPVSGSLWHCAHHSKNTDILYTAVRQLTKLLWHKFFRWEIQRENIFANIKSRAKCNTSIHILNYWKLIWQYLFCSSHFPHFMPISYLSDILSVSFQDFKKVGVKYLALRPNPPELSKYYAMKNIMINSITHIPKWF